MFSNIIAEMARNSMTRQEFANYLDISLPTLRKKLSGEIDFKLKEIKIILKIFNNELSFDYLFFEESVEK